jgi:hypothetical protein
MNDLAEVVNLLERVVSLLEEIKVEVTEENRREFSYEASIDPRFLGDGEIAVLCGSDWSPRQKS